jgi:hypothetical protein
MKSRDKAVIAAILLIVVALGGYLLLVSPQHTKAQSLQAQITTARGDLDQAEAMVQSGSAAQAQYKAYAKQLKSISIAVPGDEQIPELINELQSASSKSKVGFQTVSISTTASATTAGAATTTATAAATTTTSFPSQDLNLSFTGSYFSVANLLGRLDGFVRADNTHFHATGRLITIGSLTLAPGGTGTSAAAAGSGAVTATVTAVDYDVPTALASTASTAAAGSTTSSGTTNQTAYVTH